MYYLHLAPSEQNIHHDNRACFTFISKHRTRKAALAEAKKLGFSNIRLSSLKGNIFTNYESIS